MKCYIKDYPRPQFVRKDWVNLNGIWDFGFDDENVGESEKWYEAFRGNLQIQVPFTYEAKSSGIGEEAHHDNVWYRRKIQVDGEKLKENNYIIHFEGSDFETKLWVNGQYAGSHRGGYARFSFDITNLVKDGENELTVKVEDSRDIQQSRGKQRWRDENYIVFYVQTTGIWKTVWAEYVPKISLSYVKMTSDLQKTSLELEADVIAPDKCLKGQILLETTVTYNDELVNRTYTALTDRHTEMSIDMCAEVSNTDEAGVKVWSPEQPNMYDIEFRLWEAGKVLDEVGSYFAMREIRIEGSAVLLNGAVLYQKLVLDQGYWKDTLLTPPDEEALIRDAEIIKSLGYNGVRKHQKIEDERFLYWCDVKGLLVWSEAAAAFRYTDYALTEFAGAWMEIIRQNYNHPCIITWTPFNESWGIPNVKKRADQQCFTEAIYYLTKSMDPYRPVITNDGWEHTVSDIITLHDYCQDGGALKQRWIGHKEEILSDKVSSYSPRAAFADGFAYRGQPIMISEYGGIAIRSDIPGGGYGNMVEKEDFAQRFEQITTAIKEIPYVCGYCYTQLSDVQQEINGHVDMERNYKIAPDIIRKINEG